jgi:hypothetical protein
VGEVELPATGEVGWKSLGIEAEQVAYLAGEGDQGYAGRKPGDDGE